MDDFERETEGFTFKIIPLLSKAEKPLFEGCGASRHSPQIAIIIIQLCGRK
jgi:hypothetical protein